MKHCPLLKATEPYTMRALLPSPSPSCAPLPLATASQLQARLLPTTGPWHLLFLSSTRISFLHMSHTFLSFRSWLTYHFPKSTIWISYILTFSNPVTSYSKVLCFFVLVLRPSPCLFSVYLFACTSHGNVGSTRAEATSTLLTLASSARVMVPGTT